ncbi:hypothetical protein KM1_257870 [Entamoeba histolytica HM-3:IMSS]|uniref:Uncharacterized protein n=4 Tax=Entamoeba histolytica TaxID=5759 RepID=B1N4Z0_ENTH1|nr:hypothetical protein EHI_102810 [Entamoeba histolytica HM-1:IMSS]EDS88969.1 hypothetical protein EHI_102810 [Entamoeba histolytica HM-1:IMSS]EMS12872.1 hypothetical protein KM1_257870 [Entamoeba histolytica HM-3:IMSS]ENY65247.1 hypothetical protein EHI7A_164330 [Entamoeba histolytica HM-1:IMSS-A]GAT99036.1 hypothetical protein CL6EHI_102810 [Entamoeba histolytica]|eukprot:XP_001914256.1 hypothetical protein EHI_102810 [Entamoeba histolytica HM-1:IMSS]
MRYLNSFEITVNGKRSFIQLNKRIPHCLGNNIFAISYCNSKPSKIITITTSNIIYNDSLFTIKMNFLSIELKTYSSIISNNFITPFDTFSLSTLRCCYSYFVTEQLSKCPVIYKLLSILIINNLPIDIIISFSNYHITIPPSQQKSIPFNDLNMTLFKTILSDEVTVKIKAENEEIIRIRSKKNSCIPIHIQ